MVSMSRISIITLMVGLGLLLGALLLFSTGSAVAEVTDITITSDPDGLVCVIVDGDPIITPQTYSWESGTDHTLEAIAIVPGEPGEQYVFSDWSYDGESDDDDQVITYNVPTYPGTVTADFDRQYQLTMAANFGTTTPSIGTHWYDDGSIVTIDSAPPVPDTGVQYVWNTWIGSEDGSYSGTANPAIDEVTMDGPITEAASWTRQYQLTMATKFGTTVPAEGIGWYDAGTTVSISAVAPSPGTGERFTSLSWAGVGVGGYGGSSNPASVTMNGPITETASWVHQFQLTVGSNYGTVAPVTGSWHNEGSTVTLTATAPTAVTGERFQFSSWVGIGSGSYGGTDNPASVTMNGPITESASWTRQYQLTMATNFGTVGPATGWHDSGSEVTITATAPSPAAKERYASSTWTGTGAGSYTGTSNPAIVTMNGPISETVKWTKQYQVSFVVSPSGAGETTPSGLDVWEDAGPISIRAVASEGYGFSSWTGTGSITFDSQTASTSANIGSPGTITAVFSIGTVEVTVTSIPTGTGYVRVDGNAINTPHTFSWVPGEGHTLEAIATVSVGTGEQSVFSYWSDDGVRSHSFTAKISTPEKVTASFIHQFQLTMAANFGTTTPSIGTHWYEAGSRVTLDSTPPDTSAGVRYSWNTWTGTGAGSYTGTNRPAHNAVTVDGPITETADWTRQFRVSFAVAPAGGGTTSPSGSGVWVNAGSLSIQATPAADYAHSSWTSNTNSITFSAPAASTTANINGPGTVTAHFILSLGITITSSPTGSGYVLVDGNAVTTPINYKWTSGTHTIEAISVVAGGTGEQFIFNSWSDGGTQTHTYSVTNLTGTVTAHFDRQYLLTMASNFGTTTPSTGGSGSWHSAGSAVMINAAPPASGSAGERYAWSGWNGTGSGSYTGKTASVSVIMNAAITETASWAHQFRVTMAANFGTTVPAVGAQWFDSGSQIDLMATPPTAGPGERYIFNAWTGIGTGSYSGTSNPVSVPALVTAPIDETASWTHQFRLTMAAGLGETTPSAGAHWYNAGSRVSISAMAPSVREGEQYAWAGWTGSGMGSYSGTDNLAADAVTMSAPIDETASWMHQFRLTMAANNGTTTPAAGGHWINASAPVIISATAPTEGPGEMYAFSGWTGTGRGSYTGIVNVVTVTVSGPINETASWKHNHLPGAPTALTAVPFDSQVTLNWTAPSADGGKSIDYYVVYRDGSEVRRVAGLDSTISGLTNGQAYTFTVAAHNQVGTGPYSTAVSATPLKATSLTVKITSPSSGSYHSIGSVLLKWVVSGPHSEVTKIKISTDGMAWSSVSGTSHALNFLDDGVHTVYVRATDLDDFVNTTSVTFTVDTTAPTVTIMTPTSGGHLDSQTVTVNWLIGENGSGVTKVEISSDGKNWTEQTGNVRTLSMPDGFRTIHIRATDKAGNLGTNMTAFFVDTQAPTVLTRSPMGSKESTKVTVNVTFSEQMDQFASGITVGGVNGTTSWDGNSMAFTPSAALRGMTAFNVTVSGRDMAGNSLSSTWTFRTAPVGQISGIVLGHDGRVLADATVQLIGRDTAAMTEMRAPLSVAAAIGSVQTTTTDKNGSFAFYDVAVGDYTLEIEEKGYGTKSIPVTMTPEAVQQGGLTLDTAVMPQSKNDGFLIVLAIVTLSAAFIALVFVLRRRVPPPVSKELEVKEEKTETQP